MNDILRGSTQYLLREATDEGNQLIDLRANDKIRIKRGAIYVVLDANDLDPIDVLLGTRRGDTLVVTLPDGTIIELNGFFPNSEEDSDLPNASFSNETTLRITDVELPVAASGGSNLFLWGLGGLAALGAAGTAAGMSGGGDVSNVTVTTGTDDDSGPTAAERFTISRMDNVTAREGVEFKSQEPQVTNAQGSVTWTLEGEDADLFTIDPVTGVVTAAGKDFESPKDTDGDNIYRYTIVATDSAGNRATETVAVTVADTTEASDLKITGLENTSISENENFVFSAAIEGAIGEVSWELTGDDAQYFTLDSASGEIYFSGADYERPLDKNGDNDYRVRLAARDEDGNYIAKTVSLSVDDTIESSPIKISGINSDYIQESFAYNSSAPVVSGAVGAVTWSLEGLDKSNFTIDPISGAITLSPRDYESPTDTNGDNNYSVELVAVDADGNRGSKALNIAVLDRDENRGSGEQTGDYINVNVDASSPAESDDTFDIIGITSQTLTEGVEYISPTPQVVNAVGAVTFTLEGKDAAVFNVDEVENEGKFYFDENTGVVYMTPKSLSSPEDSDENNSYLYTLVATDSAGNVSREPIAVKIVPEKSVQPEVDEEAPLDILGISNQALTEGNEYISPTPQIINAVGAVTFTLEGDDAAAFDLDPLTGVVSMAAKDASLPTDFDGNNSYRYTLVATDSAGAVSREPIVIKISPPQDKQLDLFGVSNQFIPEGVEYISETPTVTNNVGEVTYRLEGEDASLFTVDSLTGVVNMPAKDLAVAQDFDGNSSYRYILVATDAAGNIVREPVSVKIGQATDTNTDSGDTNNNGNTNDPVTLTPPSLLSLTSTAGDKTYGFDETVQIRMAFNKAVRFDSGSVPPVLKLSNGEEATYASGNGSYYLFFEYTVGAGDVVSDLDVTRIELGSLKGVDGKEFGTTYIEDISSNLADNVSVDLDATPRIIEINSVNNDGTYGEGSIILIDLILDQQVTLLSAGDIPSVLALSNGGIASYSGGSGSDTLRFEYVIGPGEDISDLNVLAFAENEKAFENSAGLKLSDSLSNLRNGNLADNKDISVGEPTVPSVIAISSADDDGVYRKSDVIEIQVQYDSPVFISVNGDAFDSLSVSSQDEKRPYLALNSGGVASYVSGSGTDTLLFSYVPEEGDLSLDLDVLSIAENGSDILDNLGNAVKNAIAPGLLSANKALVVDAESPEIISMHQPTPTQTIEGDGKVRTTGIIKVNFDSTISVIGSDSKLILSNLDDPDNPLYPAMGQFVEVENSNTIVYSYDGYLVDELIPIEVTALIENGTVIADLSGNTAKTKIVSGVNDIAGTILAGAGEFVGESLGIRVFAADGTEIFSQAYDPRSGTIDYSSVFEQQDTGPVLIEIFDVNGTAVDYRDEYTGELISLDSSTEQGAVLRSVVDVAELKSLSGGDSIAITPLSELAVRLGLVLKNQPLFDTPLDSTFLIANELVANLFKLDSVTFGSINFIDTPEFQSGSASTQADYFGMALAALSILDSTTGSISNTLDELLQAWSEEARARQENLESPGVLYKFLQQAVDLLPESENQNIDIAAFSALDEYIDSLDPFVEEEAEMPEVETQVFDDEKTLEDSADIESSSNNVEDKSSVKKIADNEATQLELTTTAIAADQPATSSDVVVDSAQQATLRSTASLLLQRPNVELKQLVMSQFSSLGAETGGTAETEAMQELAAYTSSFKVQSALLASGGVEAATSVSDYHQLGFQSVNENNKAYVDHVVFSALSSQEATTDLAAKIIQGTEQLDRILALASPDENTTRSAVAVNQDSFLRLDNIAGQWEQIFGDSTYDDTLIEFLSQQLLSEGGDYIVASLELAATSGQLSAIELPSSLSASDFINFPMIVEGRDASGIWAALPQASLAFDESGVATISADSDYFTSFRLLLPESTPIELRQKLAGESLIFETRSVDRSAFASPLEGAAQFTSLKPEVAARLLSWSGAEDWTAVQALDQLTPDLHSLYNAYLRFYEKEPDVQAQQTMLSFAVSLSADPEATAAALPLVTPLSAQAFEALTGIEMATDAALNDLISGLKASHLPLVGTDELLGELSEYAWVAQSDKLLAESFDELAVRVMDLQNSDMSGTKFVEEAERLGSIIRFKKFLLADEESASNALNADDFLNIGLTAPNDMALLTRFIRSNKDEILSGQKSLSRSLDALDSEVAAAQAGFASLFDSSLTLKSEIAVSRDDSIERLMTLASTEYSEDQSVMNELNDALLGVLAGQEKVLARLDVAADAPEYLSIFDENGQRIETAESVSVRVYGAEADTAPVAIQLAPVPGLVGLWSVPSLAENAKYLEITASGFDIEELGMTTIQAYGRERLLTPEDLTLLGHEGYSEGDISTLYRVASAIELPEEAMSADEFLETYALIKPALDSQDSESMESSELHALWQWGSDSREQSALQGPETAQVTGQHDIFDELRAIADVEQSELIIADEDEPLWSRLHDSGSELLAAEMTLPSAAETNKSAAGYTPLKSGYEKAFNELLDDSYTINDYL